ncbi:50S ribosomal protein L37ae [Candidatus Woesearchaeota archaeon]|nr:50S ribosomal protein L37ae [Candidatus Woesearchaeota archaeon]
MATKKTLFGSVKRFGSRYGRTLRQKIGKVEHLQKKQYACPICHYKKVKRVSKGVWSCEKCGAKFTSKAYTITKQPSLKEAEEEEAT